MFKKTTTKDIVRQTRTETRHSNAQLDREVANLTRQENQLVAEIKKAAAKGQKPTVNMLTKQLIRTRKQKEQLMKTKATVTGVQYQTQVCRSVF